jgi:branched-chain amino acid transport system permease protein
MNTQVANLQANPRRRPALTAGAALLIVAALGYTVPSWLGSPFYLGLANQGLILGVLAVAVAFLMHQCKLVLFGIAAFYGAPAYLFAIASTNWSWSPSAAALFALTGTLSASFFIGAAIVRAKPLAFAMLTLAIAQMLRQLVLITSLRSITGGEDGINVDFKGALFGLSQQSLAEPRLFWLLGWTVVCVVVLIAIAAVRSHFGRVLRGIRDNEERMRFSGYETFAPRLAAFMLASLIATLGGLLQVLNSGFVSPELLDFALAGNVLVSALIGGAASVIGPIVGAVAFTLGLDQFAASGHLELFTGIAIVVVIAAFPEGLGGFVSALSRRKRERALRVEDTNAAS